MPGATGFKDHFSQRSRLYARYRPTYPDALFQHLASLCVTRSLAWDCATGNGQAAAALAAHFDAVIATDASEQQIAAAQPVADVEFRKAPAEASGLGSNTVDLITVGQALHWFDRERFFDEATRVLIAGGVLAAWCYELCHVTDECDAIVSELYEDIVGEFWPPERRLIEEGYASIELPGEAIAIPRFEMTADWSTADMLGYLRTWSACKRYEEQNGSDPVQQIAGRLEATWGGDRRVVRWPLRMRASRV